MPRRHTPTTTAALPPDTGRACPCGVQAVALALVALPTPDRPMHPRLQDLVLCATCWPAQIAADLPIHQEPTMSRSVSSCCTRFSLHWPW